ncbi:coiled-coil domain-containing protein 15 isoform X1 [Sinocyclocheilus anshuiensis]|uniref:coiled-coil domain-containing protein 15 isoform X1 n=1 Tax=Sinocyclocheilus anshuiensis TaxID=1608454 RepID=UPI0007B96534|nr:PREDICTED: coiled-coil domain-containing protein 15 isoform X1 [Sinocyclocheilus anshuiensis]
MNQTKPAKVRVCSSITQKKLLKENKRITSGNRRKATDVRVLAERNPAVAPVGVWVESGDESLEHPAVRALLTEEFLEETRREKEESLRRFQDSVRERVSQQARLRKQQQLLKSYETVECESKVSQLTSKAAPRLTPQTNLFPSWTHGERAICSPSSCCVSARGTEAVSSHHHTHNIRVSKVRKQVRHRLAARQTVQEGDELSQLPGGRWKLSPARDKPESHTWRDQKDTEGTNYGGEEYKQDVEVEDEMLLGQHDQPLDLHRHRSKTVTFQNDMVYEPDEPDTVSFTTDYRASQVLWPHDHQEELKRQRQSQFLMYRRHFMDIEREQVKEHRRHRKHLKRTASIKNEKEQLRKAEEKKMERQRQQEEERKDMAEREYLILEQLRLDEEEAAEKVERREKTKSIKESKRYIEAMQALMKKKLEKDNVELPPLCCCGDTFWDSHPDTCANNCIFYNNPKVYAQALQSVLLRCDLKEEGFGQYASTWKASSMDVHSQRK